MRAHYVSDFVSGAETSLGTHLSSQEAHIPERGYSTHK